VLADENLLEPGDAFEEVAPCGLLLGVEPAVVVRGVHGCIVSMTCGDALMMGFDDALLSPA
jgi:hypothetical protein